MALITGGAVLLLLLALSVQGVPVAELAEKYAPRLRFDMKAGSDDLCFPGNADEYYEERRAGNTGRICNLDYQTILDRGVATYWQAAVCGYHLHIAYWSFFGYNHNCDCCMGERDAWWESLVVKVRDYDLDERLHEVRFSQKDGWYTRVPGRYELVEGTHPVAYVGKANHGFFHDDGGTGTCCYYQDFRDPHEVDQHQDTWLRLQQLDNSSAWMTDPDTGVWSGISSPLFRDDWNLCELNGCSGSYAQVCTNSGCHKSDTGEDPF